MTTEKRWTDRSPEEQEQIRINRERASYRNPFTSKNRAARYRLNAGFNAMASRLQKMSGGN